jgi:hypothetical protein
MRKRFLAVAILSLLLIGLPMSVSALGLDVEAKGGAGVALGTTDNPDITGAARLAAGGGVGVDLYLLSPGGVDLGISAGVEYSYLTFHSTWANFVPVPLSDQTTDEKYNYVNVPIALVASVPLAPALKLVARAGGFIGFFLSGTADNTYSSPFIPSNTATLDSSNTIQMEYGIHATAGVDIDLGGLAISPAVQFDMGLTDTSVNGGPAGNFKDTFWSLTAVIGIKFKVL